MLYGHGIIVTTVEIFLFLQLKHLYRDRAESVVHVNINNSSNCYFLTSPKADIFHSGLITLTCQQLSSDSI